MTTQAEQRITELRETLRKRTPGFRTGYQKAIRATRTDDLRAEVSRADAVKDAAE